MHRRTVSVLIVVLSLAMTASAPRTQVLVEVPQALLDRAASDGDVAVIVGVGARFLPEGDLAGAAAVAAQRAAMAQAVDDTMARVAATGANLGERFAAIPYFTARVNRAQLEALAATPGVSSIGEDRVMTPSLNVSTGLVQARAAWTAGHDGSGWGVAVLDSGVDVGHPFLDGKVATQACYSSTTSSGGVSTTSVCPGGNSDTSGGTSCSAGIYGCDHGTHVAGIAAGAGAPNGVNGVAPGAVVHSIQVFSRRDTGCPDGASPCLVSWTSDQIRALERVLALHDQGYRIAAVNMSLGADRFEGADCDASSGLAATKAAMDNLRSVGIATVVASGNDSHRNGIAAPACLSTAVAVGATTRGACPGAPQCPAGAASGRPNVPAFSNHSVAIELLAPGVGINSSVPGAAYAAFTGTSMAAPHVAGAWAILKHAAPAAGVSTVLAALSGTGVQLTEPFTQIARPIIDINAARQALLGVSGTPGIPGTLTADVNGSIVTLNWGAASNAAGYQVLARFSSGGAVATSLTVGNQTSFAVNAPNGSYFVSVRGVNGSGPGPESNVVPVTVHVVPERPGTPTELAASVAGNQVSLTWTAPTSGGPVSEYVLLAARTPEFSTPLATLVVPAPRQVLVVAGVPAGTWYARVYARNAGGNSEFASNEVSLTVVGPQPPGVPTLDQPVVMGRAVTLSWAAGEGGAPTSYTLHASMSPGGAPFASLNLTGTSAGVPNVPPGTYYLRLVARNSLGVSAPSAERVVIVP